MLELAMVIGFGIFATLCFFLAVSSKDQNRPFRILFMVFGFLCLYAMFTVLASFVQAYTVPANQASPYYAQADIASFTNLLYGFGYGCVVALLLYLGIELVLFIRVTLLKAQIKKNNSYEDAYRLE